FAGGAVGYLGYGAARWFDPAMHTIETAGNDAVFMIFHTVLAFDHARQQLHVRAIEDVAEKRGEERKLRLAFEDASSRTQRVVEALRRPIEWKLPDFDEASPV